MHNNITNGYDAHDELFMYKEANRSKRPLIIHVEDRRDIVFWRKIFAPYEDNLDIDYVSVHPKRTDKSDNSSSSGKSIIMSLIQKGNISLSVNEIACVDADYDLLIDDTYTNALQQEKFIFTTVWHSIENIICHPRNLYVMYLDILQESKCPIDYNKLIKEKSEFYAELFLFYLSYRQLYKSEGYSIEDMADEVSAIEGNRETIAEILETHKEYMEVLTEIMIHLQNELLDKGYKPNEYHKIMQGHLLLNQIVYPTIKNALQDEFQKRHMDYGEIESDLQSFFKCNYSVEYLDITKTIRSHIEQTLNI